jgi:hypothetical protein
MDMEKEDKYGEEGVRCAAETLIKAEDIKKDAKLMALVKGHMEKSAKAIKSIKELRKVAAAKMAEREEPEEDEGDEEELDEKLMTEEDKAALQEQKKVDKNLEKIKLK